MTIPNIISIIRMFLVPLIIVFIFIDFSYHYYFAIGLYIIAMGSDVLDGYIARKYNMESPLGRFLDPLADKLVNVLLVITLTTLGIFPLLLGLLSVARDLLVDAIINQMAALKISITALWSGKVRTLTLTLAIITGLLILPAKKGLFFEICSPELLQTIAFWLLLSSILLTFIGIEKPIIKIYKEVNKKWKK